MEDGVYVWYAQVARGAVDWPVGWGLGSRMKGRPSSPRAPSAEDLMLDLHKQRVMTVIVPLIVIYVGMNTASKEH